MHMYKCFLIVMPYFCRVDGSQVTFEKVGFRAEVTLNDRCLQTCCDHFTASVIMTVRGYEQPRGLNLSKSESIEQNYKVEANINHHLHKEALEEVDPQAG